MDRNPKQGRGMVTMNEAELHTVKAGTGPGGTGPGGQSVLFLQRELLKTNTEFSQWPQQTHLWVLQRETCTGLN